MIEYLSFELNERFDDVNSYLLFISREKKIKNVISQIKHKKKLDSSYTYYNNGIDVIEPCSVYKLKSQCKNLKPYVKIVIYVKWINSVMYEGIKNFQSWKETYVKIKSYYKFDLLPDETIIDILKEYKSTDDHYIINRKIIYNDILIKNLFNNDTIKIKEFKNTVRCNFIHTSKKNNNTIKVLDCIKENNNTSIELLSTKLNISKHTIGKIVKENRIKLNTTKIVKLIQSLDNFFDYSLRQNPNINYKKLNINMISNMLNIDYKTLNTFINSNIKYKNEIKKYNNEIIIDKEKNNKWNNGWG